MVGKDMPESQFASVLEEVPATLTQEERDAWTQKLKGVALSSDAFFPFRDNVDRAKQVLLVVLNVQIITFCYLTL